MEKKHNEEIKRLQSEKAELEALENRREKQDRQALEKVQQEYEERIKKLREAHRGALKQAELDKLTEIRSVTNRVQNTQIKAEQDHQLALKALNDKYIDKINRIQSNKKSENEAIKREASEKNQQALKQRLLEFKAQVARMKYKHAEKLRQAEQKKQEGIEAGRREAEEIEAKAEKEHKPALNEVPGSARPVNPVQT